MRELPEVEVTRRCMSAALQGQPVRTLRVYERRLRWPVPPRLASTLSGRHLERIDRRGKYLLWRFEHGVLISHLGMTGSWRSPPAALARLPAPRRFGALLWHPASAGDVARHRLLASLGAEPLEPQFDGERLYL